MTRSRATADEPVDTVAPGDLAGLLRAHAAGRLADTAAVDLLITHRHWLTRPAFTGRFVHAVTATDGHPVGAFIDWHAAVTAVTAVDRGELPCSGSEADVLRIAASLGAGTQISLRDVLGGLDRTNITAVTAAITAANGARPE